MKGCGSSFSFILMPARSICKRTKPDKLKVSAAFISQVTNAIESLNASLRKVTKTRRSFPNDEAVMKVLYLAVHEISKKWTMPVRGWKQAMSQFMILFGERASL